MADRSRVLSVVLTRWILLGRRHTRLVRERRRPRSSGCGRYRQRLEPRRAGRQHARPPVMPRRPTVPVILEHALLRCGPAVEADFERRSRRRGTSSRRCPGFGGPDAVAVPGAPGDATCCWCSGRRLEDHTVGFRGSPGVPGSGGRCCTRFYEPRVPDVRGRAATTTGARGVDRDRAPTELVRAGRRRAAPGRRP